MSGQHKSAWQSQFQAEHLACGGVRANLILRWFLALLALGFGVFVWYAFVAVPTPHPWMMGELAITKILITNGVALIGSVANCALAQFADWRLKTRLFRYASLPCAAYLIVVIVRNCLGLPLSIG